jgi:hypothetical protein
MQATEQISEGGIVTCQGHERGMLRAWEQNRVRLGYRLDAVLTPGEYMVSHRLFLLFLLECTCQKMKMFFFI